MQKENEKQGALDSRAAEKWKTEQIVIIDSEAMIPDVVYRTYGRDGFSGPTRLDPANSIAKGHQEKGGYVESNERTTGRHASC